MVNGPACLDLPSFPNHAGADGAFRRFAIGSDWPAAGDLDRRFHLRISVDPHRIRQLRTDAVLHFLRDGRHRKWLRLLPRTFHRSAVVPGSARRRLRTSGRGGECGDGFGFDPGRLAPHSDRGRGSHLPNSWFSLPTLHLHRGASNAQSRARLDARRIPAARR